MPQHVCDQIYTEVRAELRADRRWDRVKRSKKFVRLSLTRRLVTLVVLFLIGLGIFRLIAPDACQAVADCMNGAVRNISSTTGNILSGIAGFFRWLIKALCTVAGFMM